MFIHFGNYIGELWLTMLYIIDITSRVRKFITNGGMTLHIAEEIL